MSEGPKSRPGDPWVQEAERAIRPCHASWRHGIFIRSCAQYDGRLALPAHVCLTYSPLLASVATEIHMRCDCCGIVEVTSNVVLNMETKRTTLLPELARLFFVDERSLDLTLSFGYDHIHKDHVALFSDPKLEANIAASMRVRAAASVAAWCARIGVPGMTTCYSFRAERSWAYFRTPALAEALRQPLPTAARPWILCRRHDEAGISHDVTISRCFDLPYDAGDADRKE